MYRQFDLRTDDRRVTCWLKWDGELQTRLRPGALVTLKHEPDTWWSVERMYDPVLRTPPERFWKVGGLM